ncbi:MAG TPA: TetR/AcrR family transcriptional regulator [Streptosporangiaceae bacterium]|jgi:AcrR family transcriptional regulator
MTNEENDTDPAVRIPRRYQRLWGVAEPSRRGPRPRLSLDAVARAGIEIADAEGISAVSMSRVAKALGYTTMSLYRYVDSKDELIEVMVDRSGDPPPDPDPGLDWRAALERWAYAQLDVFRDHPWTATLPVSGPPLSPRALRWMEAGLDALADTPLTHTERVGVLLAVTMSVLNAVRLGLELSSGDDLSPADYGRAIGTLVTDVTHPHLTAAVRDGAFHGDQPSSADSTDDDFAFGLGLTLDGVDALIARRGPRPRPRPRTKAAH